jgi:hypothetical protein
MTTTAHNNHPITTLIDQAADNIRLANHASFGDTREVTELYDTVGALAALLNRLPHLLAQFQLIIRDADARSYIDASGESDADHLLFLTEGLLAEATASITEASGFINGAWSHIGRLRPRDTDDQPE